MTTMKRSRLDEVTGSQTGAGSQVRIKQENDDSNATHPHTVYVKPSASDTNEFTNTCHKSCTVLQLLKKNNMNKPEWSDENIVIQMGKADKKSIIATHFPCTCINEGELLTLSYVEKQKVEEAQGQREEPIGSRDRYSVFYIETVGGKNTITKELFKNRDVKEFKFVVVYGEKGTTVEEALKRDGRFRDDLGDFTLSHNENPHRLTKCTQTVDILDKNEFKLCRQRKIPKEISGPTLAVLHQRGISVRTAMTKPGGIVDLEEIYEELRKQFSDLKEWMKSRFSGDSYQKALDLKSEDFGKIQQSFSEVHRVRKLLKLGESVCKVIVEGYCQGTGFVLFGNYILTNAHLFKDCAEGQTLKQDVNVYVLFNYEKPEPFTNYNIFQVADYFICLIEDELDYAVLKIIPNEETREMTVPPGLLKTVGPIPQNGEACIIGHPGGQVKQMDPTCIIEKENRGNAVDENLHRNTLFNIHVFNRHNEQGIDQIMMGGKRAEKVVTYNTFMYHGSSGSPVFDAHCKVVGLHTSGYFYDFPKEGSAIEFAQPLLTILEHFLKVLKKCNLLDLLRRVEEEAKGNSDLKKVLEAVGIKDEPADAQ